MSTPDRVDAAPAVGTGLGRGGAGLAVAMGVMNVATYGFNILAAHLLGPVSYGAVAAILNVLLVVTVLQLGLQATAARRVAADPAALPQVEQQIRRINLFASGGLGLLLLALTPVLDRLIGLNSLPTAVLIAVSAVPLTMMGGQAGLLQGEERWLPLSLIYLGLGVGRLVLGAATMLWRPDELGAAVGIAIGAFVPAIVGELALRHHSRADSRPRGEHPPDREILREVLTSSHALLAFLALSNVDVIIARTVLPHHDAGLYAGGLILTKAVLFLPQFVVVAVFPAMARRSESTPWRALGLIAGLGAVGTLATWLLSGVAVIFVGGHEYAGIQHDLWGWAVLGTVLSMIQLLVYGVLARRHGRAVWLVWAGLAGILVGAQFVHSTGSLLATVTAVDTVVLVVLALVGMRRPAATG